MMLLEFLLFSFLNIKVNSDTTRSVHNEEQIVVNPLDSNNVVAVWRDYRLGFRQVGVAYTTDGGLTWDDTLFVERTYPFQTDPGLTVDASGNFYAVILSFTSTFQPNGLFVYKSSDGGRTWGPPVPVVNGVPGVFEDKELIACDRTTSPYSGNLYVAWTRFYDTKIMLSRSTDSNRTWSSPIQISDGSASVQWPVPAVGARGEVYVAWIRLSSPKSIRIDKSTDGGVTWGTDRTVQNVNFGWGYIGPSSSILVFSYPAIDVDITQGPYQGNIYIAYMDYGPTISETDLYFTKSTDGGQTWTSRIRLNDDSLGNRRDQFHPWLTVSRDGVISVIWYDRRLDPNNILFDVFLTQSTDGGETWTPNVRVSTVSSDPRLFPPPDMMPAGLLGEYNGLAAASKDKIYAIWADTRLGSPHIFVGIRDTLTGIETSNRRVSRGSLEPVSVTPNPFNKFTVIRLPQAAFHNSSAVLRIYDINGRLVKSLTVNGQRKAETGIIWNGEDEASQPVKKGVYLLTVQSALCAERILGKVIRVTP